MRSYELYEDNRGSELVLYKGPAKEKTGCVVSRCVCASTVYVAPIQQEGGSGKSYLPISRTHPLWLHHLELLQRHPALKQNLASIQVCLLGQQEHLCIMEYSNLGFCDDLAIE